MKKTLMKPASTLLSGVHETDRQLAAGDLIYHSIYGAGVLIAGWEVSISTNRDGIPV